MARHYEPMTLASFVGAVIEKSIAVMVKEDEYDASDYEGRHPLTVLAKALQRGFSAKIRSDLAKVDFDLENLSTTGVGGFDAHADLRGLMGPTRHDDLSFIGCLGGGDWQTPVYFVLYHDGTEIRAYVPEKGNSWDPETKAAVASGKGAFKRDEIANDLIKRLQRRPDAPQTDDLPEPELSTLDDVLQRALLLPDFRDVSRAEAFDMLNAKLFDATYMGEKDKFQEGGQKITNDQIANLLVHHKLAERGSVRVVGEPEKRKVRPPRHPRVMPDEVQAGIVERLSGLVDHAAKHGLAFRVVDGKLRIVNTEGLAEDEDEGPLARHYARIGEIEVVIVDPTDEPEPEIEIEEAEEAPEPEYMTTLRDIRSVATAVLAQRGLTVDADDPNGEDAALVHAIKFNGITTTVKSDLSEIRFGLDDVIAAPAERMPASNGPISQLLGAKALPDGRAFIGMLGKAKGFHPVFFLIWHDGKEVRGLAPYEGNAIERAFDEAVPETRKARDFDVTAILGELVGRLPFKNEATK